MTTPPFEDPRRVLRRHGARAKRSFSQNFLVSESIVERIAEALGPADSAPVVELGPGVGTLTAALLRRGHRVIAIEKDRDMIALLGEEFGALSSLEVRAGDAARIQLESLFDGVPLRVVGNLPYAITGRIFRSLTAQQPLVRRAVLMIQREVRDRLVAAPGTSSYGALSVFVQAAFSVERVLSVPAGAFHPRPKVDSAVIALEPRPDPIEESERFRTVVRAAFAARRKTLRNGLRGAGFSTEEASAALAELGLGADVRGESLAPSDFDRLSRRLLPEPAPHSDGG
ncbi:MAG: 16S rRNA (adenine(1518)-N(6)/adenine(1519)-N(6))-dimethyltransferase RsmA [Myxococcota bacterium]